MYKGNTKKLEFSCKFIGKRLKHRNVMDEQYWQRSKIPTMHFQPSLPRLPIPELNKTCERYLLALKPLLRDESFIATQKIVQEFNMSDGNTLQNMLKEWDNKNKHTSYISKLWFDMYLKDRKPLPINYNPALVFVNDKRSEYNTQLIRAANLIISSLRFYRSLKDNVLEPEVFHMIPKKSDTDMFRYICSKVPSFCSWYVAYMFNAYPLDMSQYYNLFNSSRIPKIEKDIISSNHVTKHILVQCNGNFYVFDVLDDDGYIITPESIVSNLKSIIDDNITINKFPLGILTTLKRNDWATLRNHLENLGNWEALKLIDTALFNVCLDNTIINEEEEKLCRTFLHGNGKDRWFDKSISLIISKDGVAGVNFEHSWGDGVAVLRYFLDIYTDSTTNSKVNPNTNFNLQTNFKKLDIILDGKLKTAITDSLQEYEVTCNSMGVHVVVLDKLGKNICKKHRVSPDSIMQLGFQVAYHKLTGTFASTYESCSTAAFKHGRTETVRPCTTATKSLAEAFNSKDQWPSISKLQHLIIECSKVHGHLTKEAAMGQGFDRHLFALRMLAEANNMKIPTIFLDSAYEKINHNILSTSTLSSPIVWAGGFGPVVKDGYGIAYSMRDDSLGVLATTYESEASGGDYTEALKIAYEDILRVLEK